MRASWLGHEEENLFQAIRARRADAQEQGVKLIDLSIGEPRGPALLSAREAAATATMSDKEEMHRYQYNDSPGVPGFAKMFVEFNVGHSIEQEDVSFLPIPGIKRMLGLIPLACGASRQTIKVGAMTDPGYPFPKDWCAYLGVDYYALSLTTENTFRFSPEDIHPGTQLLMINYPHNPTGRVADRSWWEELCQHCSDNGIRVFNDAAYATLTYSSDACTLTEVAVDFPELSWVEAFSASKIIGNGTGWQVGAMTGSPDFVGDLAKVKGNTDEGFVAAMAAGVKSACENDREGIDQNREMYRVRLRFFIDLMTGHGMQIAVQPDAAFFTLWKVPTRAFGIEITSAEQFNFLMIERTGLIGVHFDPQYIRYAVCADVEELSSEIDDAFKQAEVSYE
jgi:aspartate/methionine/tyrosine aminotransferase